MKHARLERKIRFRKFILNFLLLHFLPTNKIVVFMSQNLDKLIVKSQLIVIENNIKVKESTLRKSA